jgi:succinate dehydrogenase hydrophobic anchor subunit
MTIRKIPHPGWNLEYLMWLFMRISGLAFFLLAFTGMVVALVQGARAYMGLGTLMRWTFFPNPFHVQAEVPDVDLGWRSGFWQAIEISILFFAGTHGLNGLRYVLEDYFTRPVLQFLFRTLIFILWIFLLVVAVFVVMGS